MKVYIFGNIDLDFDNRPFQIAKKLKLDAITVKPNADLPFADGSGAIIIDTVHGLDATCIFTNSDLDNFESISSSSVHDFDLGFQLKYLAKLGKLGNIVIIAIPPVGKIDYDLIHLTLRKLVAQDMQGS